MPVPETVDFRTFKLETQKHALDPRLQRPLDALPDRMQRDDGGLDLLRALFIIVVKGWPS